MFEGLRKLTCMHKDLTPTDEHGYAICRDCGGVIPVYLTKYQLDKAFDAISKRKP